MSSQPSAPPRRAPGPTRLRGPALILAAALAGGASALAKNGPASVPTPLEGSGVLAGPVVLSPSLEVETGYSDNYLREADGDGSAYASVKPSLLATTFWGPHQAALFLGAEATSYFEGGEDDVYAAEIGARLLLSAWRGGDVILGAGYEREVETSADDSAPAGADGPTGVNTLSASVAVRHNPGLIGLHPFLEYDRILHEATDLEGGGEASNDERDRSELTFGLETTYEYSAGYQLFLRGVGSTINYDEEIDTNGLERGSTTATGLLGVNFRVTNLIEGSAGFGYSRRMFDEASFDDVDTIALDVTLDWSPLETLRVSLNGFQTFAESTIDDVSVQNDLGFKLRADYALYDDISLSSSLGYTHSTFEGVSRTDQTLEAGLALAYHLSEFVRLEAGYEFARDASNTEEDATENRVYVGLDAQY